MLYPKIINLTFRNRCFRDPKGSKVKVVASDHLSRPNLFLLLRDTEQMDARDNGPKLLCLSQATLVVLSYLTLSAKPSW